MLEAPGWVDVVEQGRAAGSAASARTGRPGIPPDRVLRCCVMKHLKGWSFRDLERELRSNLVYRRFTPLDAQSTPRFSTLRRTLPLFTPPGTEQNKQRGGRHGREASRARGRKPSTGT